MDESDEGDCGMVISLATGEPITQEGDPTSTPHSPRTCVSHYYHGWRVDDEKRTLNCQRCGEDLDPYKALGRIAREFEAVRRARAELKSLREHIDRLSDEEKRIKARTKNANRKDAKVAAAAATQAMAKRNDLISSWADQIGALSDQINNATGAKRYTRRRKMERKDRNA